MGDDGFGHRVGDLIRQAGKHVVYSQTLTPTLLLHVREAKTIHVVDAAYGQGQYALASPLHTEAFTDFCGAIQLLLSPAPECILWSAELLCFEAGKTLSPEAELFALNVAKYIATKELALNY